MARLTREKAGKMLRDGEIGGKPLTQAQEGFFGLIKGGGKPTRLKKQAFRSMLTKRKV